MKVFKNKIINGLNVLFAAALVLSATSCNSREKLAEKVDGTWSSAPEQLSNTGATHTTMVRVMEFNKNPETPEGTVIMSALITVDNVMTASGDSINQSLTITASGVATITGIFQAKDDDDLIVNLDYSSMTVQVDPKAVQLDYNVLMQTDDSHLEQLRPGAYRLATQQIQKSANGVFANLNEIEDIKVEGSIMTCEINDKDLSFRLQQ